MFALLIILLGAGAMSKPYNLKQLYVFYIASKYSSFKDTARHLKVSIAAVSIQIKNLESFLGFKLFERKSSSVQLTPKAKEILPIVNELFHQADLLSKKISTFKKVQDTKIVFGVHINPGRYLAPLLYRYLAKQMPHVELVFVNDDHPVSLAKLKNKEIDIMIMDGTVHDAICLQEFIPFEVAFIVCPENPIIQKQPLSLEELMKVRTLFPASISGYSQRVKTFYEEHNFPLPSETSVMSSILFPSIIPKTTYGAFVNKLVVQDEINEGKVVEVTLETSPGSMNFYLGYLKESLKNKHVKAVLNVLKDVDAFKKAMD